MPMDSWTEAEGPFRALPATMRGRPIADRLCCLIQKWISGGFGVAFIPFGWTCRGSETGAPVFGLWVVQR